MAPPSSSFAPRPPRRRDERLARVYDDEVAPLVDRRLAGMVLRGLEVPRSGQMLELGCAAGALSADLLDRLGPDGRLVALDESTALLDLARARVGERHPGRRVFFRAHDGSTRLPFADDGFDLVVARDELGERDDWQASLADLVRVVKPGGGVALATCVRGSWAEFLDVLAEVLSRRERAETERALIAHRERQPEPEPIARALEQLGLEGVSVELERWELVFRSAREFLYAPIVEHGPLLRWKELVGKGTELQETFIEAKQTIDTYWGGRPFVVTVVAGVFRGRKPGA